MHFYPYIIVTSEVWHSKDTQLPLQRDHILTQMKFPVFYLIFPCVTSVAL